MKGKKIIDVMLWNVIEKEINKLNEIMLISLPDSLSLYVEILTPINMQINLLGIKEYEVGVNSV